ncbi:MAG: NAD(P)/FAD-dependent oxidoreductase [Candidatus Zixiibacteriota bacterium]
MKKRDYDAVVIGAGPAGSVAAYEMAQIGFSVLLIEKDKKPGQPLCCAEAVARPSFEKLIDPRPEWISAYINKARLIAPNNEDITVYQPEAGLILDRQRLDFDLAQRAVETGAELICSCIGLRLLGNGKEFDEIEVEEKSTGRIKIKAKIFISAEGVEARVARLAGIDNHEVFDDVESLLQYRVSGIRIDPNTVEIYVGEEVAPKGYLWVFPKSETSANVGLGVALEGVRGPVCESKLDNFIKKRFGQYHIDFKSCGLVPKYQGSGILIKDNLLVVGDSGRVLDSFSGAGIVNAIMSGQDAGRASIEYLSANIAVGEIKKFYPGQFLAAKEHELIMYRKLRKIYTKLRDADFNDIVEALKGQFPEGRTEGVNVIKLLTQIIRTRPQLLRLVRYLI